MPQLEVPASQRHGSAPYRNHSLNLEINDLPGGGGGSSTGAAASAAASVAISEGQQTTTVHDFLSICGRGSTPTNTTQEGNRSYFPGQQPAYDIVNGSLEYPSNLHANYRAPYVSFHLQQGISVNKNWQHQQQQQPQQLGGLDVNRKQPREPSEEEDDDDDDESLDHGNKESRNQKYAGEAVQQLEVKTTDTKNLTPRSKHSATEQRRRSKINDRFQTLRKLLPNADQKRDKASFLQEVIEYVQMLHEKIRKYEGTELSEDHEEKIKTASLHKNNLAQNEVNAFYVPMASVEPLDSNGYMRTRMSSSCLLGETDVNRNSELMSSMAMQAVSQTPMCPSSYDNKPLVSRTPSVVSPHYSVVCGSKDQGSAPAVSVATQFLIKDGQTMFGHPLNQEEQFSNRGKSSHYSNTEGAGLLQSQHARPAQASSLDIDEDYEKLRTYECNIYTPNRLRMHEEQDERSWLSQRIEKQQIDVGSSSKGSRKDDCRLLDGKIDDCVRPGTTAVDGLGQEQRGEGRGNKQSSPGGVINISSVYSQGLVDTLTSALQSSGVDMSQATISVKIDLGNLGGSAISSSRRETTALHRGVVSSQESEHSKKRAKLEFDL